MNEKPTILTEHVADIPMLLAQMDPIGLVEILDAQVPIHDNWQELSCGRVTAAWLSSILSQGDHRLVPVAFDMTPKGNQNPKAQAPEPFDPGTFGQHPQQARGPIFVPDPPPAKLRGSAAAKESEKHDAHHFA